MTEAVVNGSRSNGGLCQRRLSSTEAVVGWRDDDTMASAAMASSADGGSGDGGLPGQLFIGS